MHTVFTVCPIQICFAPFATLAVFFSSFFSFFSPAQAGRRGTADGGQRGLHALLLRQGQSLRHSCLFFRGANRSSHSIDSSRCSCHSSHLRHVALSGSHSTDSWHISRIPRFYVSTFTFDCRVFQGEQWCQFRTRNELSERGCTKVLCFFFCRFCMLLVSRCSFPPYLYAVVVDF